VRQIRMRRAMWRELETGLRPLLIGHEEGNLGYNQGAAYGVTAPAFDPTRLLTAASTIFRALEKFALDLDLGPVIVQDLVDEPAAAAIRLSSEHR
jgi:hypothetical protein